ncbi:protein of unknown function [Paraburkholderia kururiensis]
MEVGHRHHLHALRHAAKSQQAGHAGHRKQSRSTHHRRLEGRAAQRRASRRRHGKALNEARALTPVLLVSSCKGRIPYFKLIAYRGTGASLAPMRISY